VEEVTVDWTGHQVCPGNEPGFQLELRRVLQLALLHILKYLELLVFTIYWPVRSRLDIHPKSGSMYRASGSDGGRPHWQCVRLIPGTEWVSREQQLHFQEKVPKGIFDKPLSAP